MPTISRAVHCKSVVLLSLNLSVEADSLSSHYVCFNFRTPKLEKSLTNNTVFIYFYFIFTFLSGYEHVVSQNS